MLAYLGDAGRVDQRADLYAGLEAVADLEGLHARGEPRHEFIVDGVVHIKPVGADAGLAGIAVFGGDGAFDGGVEIGIVKDDEGGVAAQFQAEFLDLPGALAHEYPSHFGGAGKGDLGYLRMLGDHFPEAGAALGGDHREQACGHTRPLGQNGQGQHRERRFRRGFGDHGAARRQGRRDLARDHGIGEIPRGDGGDDAHGLLEHDDADILGMAGNDVAIDPLGLLGEPFEIGGAVKHFSLGFRQRLALLGGEDGGQVVRCLDPERMPALEDGGAMLTGLFSPFLLGLGGGGDGPLVFGRAQIGQAGQNRAGCRIGHLETRAVRAGIEPFAPDESLVRQQGRVGQAAEKGGLGGHFQLSNLVVASPDSDIATEWARDSGACGIAASEAGEYRVNP